MSHWLLCFFPFRIQHSFFLSKKRNLLCWHTNIFCNLFDFIEKEMQYIQSWGYFLFYRCSSVTLFLSGLAISVFFSGRLWENLMKNWKNVPHFHFWLLFIVFSNPFGIRNICFWVHSNCFLCHYASNIQYVEHAVHKQQKVQQRNKEARIRHLYYYTWLPTNKTRDIERGVCRYKRHWIKLI